MQPTATLTIGNALGTERSVLLTEADITLGRGATNDIILADPRASRAHARLAWRDQGWTLTDLASANGTWLNEQRIQESVTVQPGDVIRIGDSLLHLGAESIAAAPAVIDTPADLEATLAAATVPVQISDTRVARLAIHAPALGGGASTWETPILGDRLTIGRQANNDIPLNLAQVSRQHAAIERRGDRFWLRDLDSTNGTYVAGRKVTEHLLQNGDTVSIGPAQLVFKQATAPDDLTLLDAAAIHSTHRSRPPVVIVPGLMGSQLWLGNERIWPNVRLLFSEPELFSLPERDHLEARGIVGEVVIVPHFLEQEQYSRAGDFLEEALGYARGRDLFEFAYDWRLDVRESARRLAEAIEAWNITPPITLIAHSLGTLVSRYYIERLGGKDKIGRALLVGGPHQGTPVIVSELVRGLSLLPFGLMGNRLRDVIKTFPSVYQILPTYACTMDQNGTRIDLLADEIWLADDQIPLLRQARQFRSELGTTSSVPTVCIYGYGLETITEISVARTNEGRWSQFDSRAQPGGDNRIPEHSAILPDAEIHPVRQGHGSLYVDNDVKARLKVELTR